MGPISKFCLGYVNFFLSIFNFSDLSENEYDFETCFACSLLFEINIQIPTSCIVSIFVEKSENILSKPESPEDHEFNRRVRLLKEDIQKSSIGKDDKSAYVNLKTENDRFTFSCDFEETQFSSSNAIVQVTSPNGGINEEKMLKIIKISRSKIQDIYETISPRLTSCANLSKMTKILIFLLVVKENIPFKLISAMTYANEAKLLNSFLEVVAAINDNFAHISGEKNAVKRLSSLSSKGTG
jgi:hypothetical protein